MVAPITGPIYKTISVKGPPNKNGFRPTILVRSSSHWRQKRPYTLPLSYDLLVSEVRTSHNSDTYAPSESQHDLLAVASNPLTFHARNKAREKLVSMLGEFAAVSVTLAERKEALSMMTNRLMQIYRFTSNLRKFRFKEAARVLGVTEPQLRRMTLRKSSRAFASNYLEFHFGWSPLLNDIGNVVNILQSGVPPQVIRGNSGKMKSTSTAIRTDPFPYGTQVDTRDYEVQVKARCEVFVSNPNLYLANQLGFVNPATVAWELVPFSFVVDWFVNVGSFLNQHSEFAGLSILNPSTTLASVGTRTSSYRGESAHSLNNYKPLSYTTTWKRVEISRSPSIPSTVLRVRQPWVLSTRRGLAAVSLLLLQLRK